MVWITEWLPNPQGKDAGVEWIELFADKTTSLAGYALVSGKSTYPLQGSIKENEYLVLTGISLGNTSGALTLAPNGIMVDRASFLASAPEEKSISRIGSTWVFTDKTPGAPNPTSEEVFRETPRMPEIEQGMGTLIPGALGIGLVSAIIFSAMMRRYGTHHDKEPQAN